VGTLRATPEEYASPNWPALQFGGVREEAPFAMTVDSILISDVRKSGMAERRRWVALLVLCLGNLMIVLDTTIVNVALPSIRADLGFTQTSLAWVINIYLLTFGGFLLLAGRMGDLLGHRRVFLAGLAVFTVASLACGWASSSTFLIAGRAVQGLGGAVVSVVALSLIMTMFTEPAERAKAMGVIGFVIAGGGSIGVFLGGVLTSVLSWHWIFLVNIPIGAMVIMLCLMLLPASTRQAGAGRIDVFSAVTVTAALMIAVYAITNANHAGWMSTSTIGLLTLAVALLAVFVRTQAHSTAPLMPLGLFRLRTVAAANVITVLWASALFTGFFLSALYLQLVLGYRPLEVGLAFLPGNVIMGCFSLGLSEKLVLRYGTRAPMAIGLLLVAAGLGAFARAPVGGSFLADVLPAMILIGLGMGLSFNPILLTAMSEVAPSEAGLASGVVNTSFMMGGAVGLAVLASLADRHTRALTATGLNLPAALSSGFHAAFLAGAVLAAAAATMGTFLLRPIKRLKGHTAQERPAVGLVHRS